TLSAPNAAYFGIPLIGNYTAGRTDSGFQGQIDEVRVYNRALGASEIATLYQAQGAIAGASQSPGTLFSGLLGWWTFDGKDITTSFVDRSGNGFNGYLIGTNNATSSRETIGKLGQGFSFAGQNTGAINLGTSASLTPTNFTIAGWVYYSSTGYCYNYIYSNSRDVSGGNGIDFKIYCNGSLNGSIWNAGSSVAVGVSVQAYVGKWVHVAFTADGSFLRMYVNGALAATQAQTISPGTPSLATCIGSMGTGGCASFTLNGKLDDVRLYNRALSASEIKQLYNMGK
ncbi:MAG TPA: LamG-like jellyroll fold domain-containing protein, partial [Candidatus Paceibacterota bacterium]